MFFLKTMLIVSTAWSFLRIDSILVPVLIKSKMYHIIIEINTILKHCEHSIIISNLTYNIYWDKKNNKVEYFKLMTTD